MESARGWRSSLRIVWPSISQSDTGRRSKPMGALNSVPPWLGYLAVAFAAVVGTLIIVPFDPAMPGLDLDGSWPAAVNTAVGRGLAFGRDVIFTMGPYASVYSRQFSPATWHLMLFGSAAYAVAVLCAIFASVPHGRRPWLFLLPFLIAMPGMHDGFFLCVPWLLVITALHRGGRGGVVSFLPTYMLVAVVALLLLIKGSTLVTAVACTGVVMLLLGRHHRLHLFLVPVVLLATLPVAWCASGQQIADLPTYFTTQAGTISGYSDAMSYWGPVELAYAFVAAATLACIACFMAPSATRIPVVAATALTLFISFKAGMVRHDEHGMMAGATLVVVSTYLVSVQNRWQGLMAAMVSGVLGLFIVGFYKDVSPTALVDRVGRVVVEQSAALVLALQGASEVRASWETATNSIRQSVPLPADGYTADLYPTDISAVIFSGERWTPRPVFQSYAAYTPALIERNVDHLRRGGPDRVYWRAASIDRRYPSLDDGASWRWLLGGYLPIACTDHYLVLANTGHPGALPLGDTVVDAIPSVGEEVPLPSGSPLWVTIRVEPSLRGKLSSLLFKAPSLALKVRYASGSERSYRVVAGMMETGFLLSPTITSTADLARLWIDGYEQTPASRVPVSIDLQVDGDDAYWNSTYHLEVSRMPIPRAPPPQQMPWEPGRDLCSM